MSRFLTPGKIALIMLIKEYANHRWPNPAIVPLLEFVLKHLNRAKDTSTFVITVKSLIEVTVCHESTVVGRTILDLLVIDLWKINCLDMLTSFFLELDTYLQRSYIARPRNDLSKRRAITYTSQLGKFLRRARHEFGKLQFHEINALWYAFLRFREPTFQLWKLRPQYAGIIDDIHMATTSMDRKVVRDLYMAPSSGTGYWVSTDQIERLLEFQVEAMQRLGARVPDETANELRYMLATGTPASHLYFYIEFLNCWRAGDYHGAFDSLHRYFDYTMHTRDRTYYQYALLNLAILQADFGCHRESVLAMRETVNAARETKDMACLSFALSWLYHFHRAHPQECPDVIAATVERESLFLLKVKARDWGMDHLLSMAYLSETRQILLAGESIPGAFESLYRSAQINFTRQIRNAVGSQMLLRSTLWSRLGVTQCAWVECEAFLSTHRECSPSEDVAVALCKSAYILSMRGRFDEAFARLDRIPLQYLRSLKINQYWTAYSGLIKLRRAVFRNEVAAAESLLQQLNAAKQIDPDCLLEIAVTKIEFLIRLGDYSSALARCERLHKEIVRNRGDEYNRVRLMILKAETFAAWKARFLPMLYQAFTVTAEIFVYLEDYDAAFEMLDAVMPQLLECEDAHLSGMAFSCLADGQVGSAGTNTSNTWREQCLNKALGYLDRALFEFSCAEDVQGQLSIISKKIRIHNFLENQPLRNDAVKLYRQKERGNPEDPKNLPALAGEEIPFASADRHA